VRPVPLGATENATSMGFLLLSDARRATP
jgi:hypothetical protein